MSFNSLDEILKVVIQWEKELDSFYGMMEEYLKNERSRETALILQKGQARALEVLKNVDLKDYGRGEYVQSVPDYSSGNIMPRFEIPADSSPKEVFETVLEYEEKLKEFYAHLRAVLNYEKSKDLLDMLIQSKTGQIKEIKALMDSCDLAL